MQYVYRYGPYEFPYLLILNIGGTCACVFLLMINNEYFKFKKFFNHANLFSFRSFLAHFHTCNVFIDTHVIFFTWFLQLMLTNAACFYSKSSPRVQFAVFQSGSQGRILIPTIWIHRFDTFHIDIATSILVS